MEVIDVPGMPGKYEVYLNGRILSCSQDTDCPGASICAVSEAWQVNQSVGMCICNTYFGLGGAYCEQFCSQAVAMAVVYLLSGPIALYIFAYSLFLLVVFIRSKICLRRTLHDQEATRRSKRGQPPVRPRASTLLSKLYLNPVAMTLIFAFLGGALSIASLVFNLLTTVGFAEYFVVLHEAGTGKMIKRVPQSWDSANYALSGISFCFQVCAVIILPLTWYACRAGISVLTAYGYKLQLAYHSVKLQASNVRIVISFSIVFTLVTLGVELPFYLLIASGNRSVNSADLAVGNAIGWDIIFFAVILINIAVLIRVHSLERNLSMRGSQTRIRRLLRRIKLAAFQLIFASIMSIVTFGGFGYFPTRRFYTDPRCLLDHTYNIFRSGKIFPAYACAICVWFVSPSVWSSKRAASDAKKQASQTGQVSNSRGVPPGSRESVLNNNIVGGEDKVQMESQRSFSAIIEAQKSAETESPVNDPLQPS